jgi:hypothetical protein
MDHQSWDVDFSRLKSFVLYRKNLLGLFLSLIIGPAFITIFLVFAILFLLKVPMEINDVFREYSEPEYQSFFQIFLLVMGSISIMSLMVMIITLFKKATPYLYFGQSNNFEEAIYVIEKKYHVYLETNRMIRFDPYTKSIREINNVDEIAQEKKRLLFWQDLSQKKRLKIKTGFNKTKIRFQESVRGKNKDVSITIRYNQTGNVQSYTKMVSSNNAGNQNIESYYNYFFHDVNFYQRIPFPKEVQDRLLMRNDTSY